MRFKFEYLMLRHPFVIVTALMILFALEGSDASYAAEAERMAKKAAFDLSPYFPGWAHQEVLGVAVWQFLAAFFLILLGLTIRKLSDVVFTKKIIPLLEKTPFAFDNSLATVASKPLGYLFLLGGIAGAFAVLPLPAEPNVHGFASGILKILVAADVVWFLFRSVDVGARYLETLAQRSESKLDDQLVPLIRKALKVTIALVCIIWGIQLFGYSVSSLVAGLGIGGLAVALALQDTLANFFGSVVIFLDRPFGVGDWIKLGDAEGVVEDIGFRSTRIRTWPTTLVSIPNKTVASATIDNWSKMPKRRVMQTVGVTYETGADQMEQAVSEIREIVKHDEGVDREYLVIRFTEFGDSSLDILLYYFTKGVALADHLATRERINLAIMRTLERMGLSIAFPTQTLYFEGEVAKGLAERFSDSTKGKGGV